MIAAPVTGEHGPLGVIEVYSVEPDAFDPSDADLIRALAGQAAIAITNARLFQQSDLISEMVHELRTPLTSIVAYSELMLRREIPPAQARGFTETIYQEAIHLSSMTNGFLELSRLQSGRIRMDMVNFSLTDLVREVLQLLQPQTDERGLTLSATLPDRAVFVSADRERIRQVLVNLTSNAIKYNRDSGAVRMFWSNRLTSSTCTSASATQDAHSKRSAPHLREILPRGRQRGLRHGHWQAEHRQTDHRSARQHHRRAEPGGRRRRDSRPQSCPAE
jgi:K+-sensing histidine kinase KdpD